MDKSDGWHIEEIKVRFGFNLHLLTAFKYLNGTKLEIDAKNNKNYMFLLVDRRRLEKIEIFQVNTQMEFDPNIAKKSIDEEVKAGPCWMTQCLGLFMPNEENKQEILDLLKRNNKLHWIRNCYFRHSEFLTFVGVLLACFGIIATQRKFIAMFSLILLVLILLISYCSKKERF